MLLCSFAAFADGSIDDFNVVPVEFTSTSKVFEEFNLVTVPDDSETTGFAVCAESSSLLLSTELLVFA
eukprot:SAG31_NODE_838_length_11617_cov_36.512936_12_plen_68_part_00